MKETTEHRPRKESNELLLLSRAKEKVGHRPAESRWLRSEASFFFYQKIEEYKKIQTEHHSPKRIDTPDGENKAIFFLKWHNELKRIRGTCRRPPPMKNQTKKKTKKKHSTPTPTHRHRHTKKNKRITSNNLGQRTSRANRGHGVRASWGRNSPKMLKKKRNTRTKKKQTKDERVTVPAMTRPLSLFLFPFFSRFVPFFFVFFYGNVDGNVLSRRFVVRGI